MVAARAASTFTRNPRSYSTRSITALPARRWSGSPLPVVISKSSSDLPGPVPIRLQEKLWRSGLTIPARPSLRQGVPHHLPISPPLRPCASPLRLPAPVSIRGNIVSATEHPTHRTTTQARAIPASQVAAKWLVHSNAHRLRDALKEGMTWTIKEFLAERRCTAKVSPARGPTISKIARLGPVGRRGIFREAVLTAKGLDADGFQRTLAEGLLLRIAQKNLLRT